MKGRTINTADLHDVVMQRKEEYGKLADLIDSIVEEMVAATPTTDRTVQDFVDKCRECGIQMRMGMGIITSALLIWSLTKTKPI